MQLQMQQHAGVDACHWSSYGPANSSCCKLHRRCACELVHAVRVVAGSRKNDLTILAVAVYTRACCATCS
jgi:hypothetical protein